MINSGSNDKCIRSRYCSSFSFHFFLFVSGDVDYEHHYVADRDSRLHLLLVFGDGEHLVPYCLDTYYLYFSYYICMYVRMYVCMIVTSLDLYLYDQCTY